jgi:2-keto-4-pentenoate hydratase
VVTERDEAGLQDIAHRFVRARRAAVALPDYPGAMPADLDTGYAIQDHAILGYAEPVAGWKVGKVPPEHVDRFGAVRLAGPIFTSHVRSGHVRSGDAASLDMPVFAGGFGAAEAEFLLRLGADAPIGKTVWSRDEAADIVASVHVGIEIASSPFPGINEHGPAVTVSDFGNNNGLIVGPEIPDWRDSGFERWPVETAIDGVVVGRATAAEMLDGAVGAVRFLLELLARRGIAAPAGLWVSTGAVTGVHPVRIGQHVVARFGSDDRMECTIRAAG